MVEFCQSPVNEAQLPLFVVNHDIMGFDIAMHDSIGVAVVQGLKEFKDVEANIIISKCGI